MRTHAGAQHIVGISDPPRPLSHRLGHGVFQSCRSGCHRVDLRSEKAHPVNVECLPLRILLTHEYFTLHTHESRRSSRCNAVLPRSCLRDHSCLSHLLCKKHLPQHVVDLVGACMVQVFTLQIDLSPAQIFTHPSCIV